LVGCWTPPIRSPQLMLRDRCRRCEGAVLPRPGVEISRGKSWSVISEHSFLAHSSRNALATQSSGPRSRPVEEHGRNGPHVSVRRFSHASIMDSSALKDRLRLLQHATDVPVPAGSIAIRRRHVVDADVDPVAVEQWISRNGGQVIPAPEPIMSGEAQWRPSSRNALAYVFPSNLLD
jgi:hypothetical protein